MHLSRFISVGLSRNTSGKFSSPIIRIAVTAIALSIVVMLLAISISTGFKNNIKAKMAGLGSHIVINSFDNYSSSEVKPINLPDSTLQIIKTYSSVKNISPFVTKTGIARTEEESQGLQLKGVDAHYNWDFFAHHLIAGDLPSYDTTTKSTAILLSSTTANQLSLKTGDAIRFYFISEKGNPPRARKFTVAGIYNTGLKEFDKTTVLCDIKQLQRLNGWSGNNFSGYEVLLNNYDHMDETADHLYALLPYNINVTTIQQIYPQLFDWLNLLDTNVIILLSLMIIVSVITICSTLLVLILEQISTIGILKALGAANRKIREIFLFQGIIIIFKGLIIGNSLGYILALAQQHFHIITLPEDSYYMQWVPISLYFSHFLFINLSIILLCSIVLITPTYIITKISPVQSIRYD